MFDDETRDGGRPSLARIQDELDWLAQRRLAESLSEAEIERYAQLTDLERDWIDSIRSILTPRRAKADDDRPVLVLVGGAGRSEF